MEKKFVGKICCGGDRYGESDEIGEKSKYN